LIFGLRYEFPPQCCRLIKERAFELLFGGWCCAPFLDTIALAN
jgi:hypothetical protein